MRGTCTRSAQTVLAYGARGVSMYHAHRTPRAHNCTHVSHMPRALHACALHATPRVRSTARTVHAHHAHCAQHRAHCAHTPRALHTHTHENTNSPDFPGKNSKNPEFLRFPHRGRIADKQSHDASRYSVQPIHRTLQRSVGDSERQQH